MKVGNFNLIKLSLGRVSRGKALLREIEIILHIKATGKCKRSDHIRLKLSLYSN